MKLIVTFLLSVFLLGTANSFALESSAQVSNRVSFKKIKQQISNIEILIDQIDVKIDEVKDCGDLGQLFDGVACFDPIEDDPTVHLHGKRPINATLCPASNESQYFNTATGFWACKAF